MSLEKGPVTPPAGPFLASRFTVMGAAAAIFDLDRTLLRGASGPALNAALAEVGLRSRLLPGEVLFYRSFEILGEQLCGMALARAAAAGVRGWPVDRVQAAGRLAAERLEREVCAYAPGLLAAHRDAGRRLVLATTTPYDLAEPLAARLGVDDLVATRYAQRDGTYTGRLEGRFVWGLGKLAAVRDWAQRAGVDLARSYAYSDSRFDLPLLQAVGYPHAVNPDLVLHAVAVARRWPVLHLDAPPGVPTLAGVELFDVARRLVREELFPYARFELDGLGHIPASGPFLLVANHRSYFDVAALALVIARTGRPTRFLAKKELFDAPVVGAVARALGGIPVDRSGRARDALGPAEQVLRAGEGLVVLPQGTIPRGPDFFDPVLRGKTGAARLAAATGAPVVPVGLWGTEAVWPRSSALPRITRVVSPPLVSVRVGPPVEGLERRSSSAAADTERILASIAALLPAPTTPCPAPTPEELARTYPRGRATGA